MSLSFQYSYLPLLLGLLRRGRKFTMECCFCPRYAAIEFIASHSEKERKGKQVQQQALTLLLYGAVVGPILRKLGPGAISCSPKEKVKGKVKGKIKVKERKKKEKGDNHGGRQNSWFVPVQNEEF